MTNRYRFLLPVVALLVIGSAPINYILDTRQSSVSAKVAFLGLASKSAGFPSMSGKVTITPDNPTDALVDVTLDARALTAPDDVTLRRLRGEKFFWVEKYPTVRFVGKNLTLRGETNGWVDGTLTARGVTREERLHVAFDRSPLTAKAGQPIALTGEMEINRYDYGMKSYRLIVGKKVTIRLKARMVPQD